VALAKFFSPQLAKFYNDWVAAGKKVAIIYVSADMNEAAFKKYYGGMPWHAIPFGDPRKAALESKCGISGIPTLVILNKKGEVVNNDAVNDVKQQGEAIINTWVH